MENKELLIKIKEQTETTLGLESSLEEGDGTEYGRPDCLAFTKSRGGLYFSLEAKIGSSWYHSGCEGIRLLNLISKVNLKVPWADFQYKLLETTGDYNAIIWPWFDHYFISQKSPVRLRTRVRDLQDFVRGNQNLTGKTSKFADYHRLFWKIWKFKNKISPKSPKIIYRFEDVDEGYDFMVVEIVLYPLTTSPTKEKVSLIIQVKEEKDGKESMSYLFRRLSTTKPAILLSLDKERFLGSAYLIEDIIWEFYDSELDKFLEVESDPNLLSMAKKLKEA